MAGAIPIAEAKEEFVDVSASSGTGEALRIWVRTWGSRGTIPVLFVHGGPGNCVADYENINADFFDATQFFVVEPDQRGTGRSEPSVRDKVGRGTRACFCARAF
jgi:pimeloyl-ACP methyl ester carboxylesterase